MLGHAVHFPSAYLNFKALALRTHYGGVQALIHVGLGHGDVVFKTPLHRLPGGMGQAQHRVAAFYLTHDNPERDNVVHLIQGEVLLHHFAINAVFMLDAPENFTVYSRFLHHGVQFAANAFSQSLASGQDVRALFEHDHTKLLGRTRAGTLSLTEDSIGLRFELTPPDTTLGRDLLVSVARGDISGMSFGFRTLNDNWDFEQTPILRTVNSAELVEITVTSMPAYTESSVQIAKRSMAAARQQQNPNALLSHWAELAGL